MFRTLGASRDLEEVNAEMVMTRTLGSGEYVGSPADAYRAVGQGGNLIPISPSHDLVVVWRWSAEAGEGFRRVVAAITS